MAPSARNKREADYSNVGQVGRKTGITLQDTGIRDEYGMEPLDGVFSSSPARSHSTRKANGNGNGNALDADLTIASEEEDMDIASSTLPEATDMMNSIRRPLRLPKSRSPIKTSLNSSPRKSLGPRASPFRRAESDTPSARDLSLPALGPRPEFSAPSLPPMRHEAIKQARTDPFLSASSSFRKAPKLNGTAKASRKRPFDLSMTEDDGEEAPDVDDVVADEADAADGAAPVEMSDGPLPVNGGGSVPSNPDESLDVAPDEQDEAGGVRESTPPRARNKAGRPKKSPRGASDASKKETKATGTAPALPGGKRRGRAAQVAKPAAHGDEEDEGVEAGPSKPAKRARRDSAPATPARKSKRKPPPSERDPNARVTSIKAKAKAQAKTKPATSPLKQKEAPRPRGKPKKGSLLVLQRTEAQEAEYVPHVSRAGRTSVKPVPYWRGAKVNYDAGQRDDKDILTLGGYKGVEPGKNAEEARPRRVRRGPKRKRARDEGEEEEEEEGDDPDVEPWEVEGEPPGRLQAPVALWDPVTQRGIEEEQDEIELALAPAAIDARVQWDKGATFKFGKTLTLPFFHSGVVELPPGGVKYVKNSRRNHMIFWVFSGRVAVNVAENHFSVGRGGMWQVPRGNFYSLTNPFARASRIYFAQGCRVSADEAEDDAFVGTPGPWQHDQSEYGYRSG